MYKWSAGEAGARKRSVAKIASVYKHSEEAFELPLFYALRRDQSRKQLERLIEKLADRAQLIQLRRYACLDSLAASIAVVRLTTSEDSLSDYACRLREMLFQLRVVLSCYDWFAQEWNSFCPFLEATVPATPYPDLELRVDWAGIRTIALDDWLRFHKLINDVDSIHHIEMDTIRLLGGAKGLVTIYVRGEPVLL